MYFAVTGLILIVLTLLTVHASRRHRREAVSNIPGPYNTPLVGAIAEGLQMNMKSIFGICAELRLKYGTVLKAWAMNRLIVLSGDVELNEQLLTSSRHTAKQPVYAILHQWLGLGLLLSDGSKWHSRRKIITPTFHFKILEQFLQVFDQQSSVLVQCLAERADDGAAFDIYPYMCSATLDIIAETAMGTKVSAQTGKHIQYTSAVKELTSLMAWRFFTMAGNWEFTFSLLCPHKKLRQEKLKRITHDFTIHVIQERRQILEKNCNDKAATTRINDDDPYDVGARKQMALLDVLLQATVDGKPLSNEDIREEVDTFMFEGHDTTTSALGFILYLLARYPLVQAKVLAEIRQIYGEDNTTPFTLQNLNDLKYMECVIKESLRLYPPVPFIGREIREDFRYKHSRLGDGVLPAGTELVIPIFDMMRNPNFYENPCDFMPERHENGDVNAAYTFIPFSAGPRNCIGQKFAMYEMKVIMTRIVQEYELLPLGQDIVPLMSIVLRSDTGMQLGLKRRTNAMR